MNTLEIAYDHKNFATMAAEFTRKLSDYLARDCADGAPVYPMHNPAEQLQRWNDDIPAKGMGENAVGEIINRLMHDSIHLHNPRYIGHQVTAPLPLAALADLTGSLMNNAMAVYEMGPAITAIEHKLCRWVADLAGFPEGANGIMTSGGSLGNLTALLAARQRLQGDVWKNGSSGRKLAVMVSAQSHYCVKRAAQIMGLGEEGVIPLETDGLFKIRIDDLQSKYKQAREKGIEVFAVIANACSTATGTFDNLSEIGDFCNQNNVWFHVDGAHGFAAALSSEYKHLLNGIDKADSIVWDMHKMMLMPALATAVVFKKADDSFAAFRQQASYLFSGDANEEWYNVGQRTIECTKRMIALPPYLSLMAYGADFFGNYVSTMFNLAKEFAVMLEKSGFELPCPPQCNIVCFRLKGDNEAQLDTLHSKIRNEILASGKFYIVQTKVAGKLYLRVTIINPLTKKQHLQELINTVLELSAQHANAMQSAA